MSFFLEHLLVLELPAAAGHGRRHGGSREAAQEAALSHARKLYCQRFPGFREVRSNYFKVRRPRPGRPASSAPRQMRSAALGKVAASGLPTSERARCPFLCCKTAARIAWGALEALAAVGSAPWHLVMGSCSSSERDC